MSKEEDFIEFDDSEAISFIMEHLPEELKGQVSEDDVQYVLDLVCDYYEDNNLMDDDDDDDDSTVSEATIAEDDMFNYIWRTIRKERTVDLSEDALSAILDGEYEYGKSIGIYTEEACPRLQPAYQCPARSPVCVRGISFSSPPILTATIPPQHHTHKDSWPIQPSFPPLRIQ